jgi:hypothetical protein
MEASKFGEEAVRDCFHDALNAALADEENDEDEDGNGDALGEVDV